MPILVMLFSCTNRYASSVSLGSLPSRISGRSLAKSSCQMCIRDSGAGLSVFMFCGFVKSIPLEIEEAAMIDGCTPLQTFFRIVMPILKPTCITVAILQAMWIWNDYLLPYLVLDMTKYKTIPIAVQYLRGGYGSIDMGAMMGVLVLAIIPIIIFYLA